MKYIMQMSNNVLVNIYSAESNMQNKCSKVKDE